MAAESKETLRIDKWLWYARFFKTRTLASAVCNGGRVRVGGATVRKSSHVVKVDDVLTFTQGPNIRVIRILGLGSRRGPASEAQQLYEDLAPIEKTASSSNVDSGDGGVRDLGSGRPTKKERRDTDKLRGD
ncbi:RNA-binding S4 domain-containing protein [Kiloniella sp.]|uniref:RNA-binding S4 domain-containing protein n=1 Tax=Kiloniella sp. TaxID=1938587 RepID=UPI003B02CF8B